MEQILHALVDYTNIITKLHCMPKLYEPSTRVSMDLKTKAKPITKQGMVLAC